MNVTIVPRQGIPDSQKASASPKNPRELVRDKLSTEGEPISNRQPTYRTSARRNLDEYIEQIADKFYCQKILAVRISDSTHGGDGVLYDVDEDGNIERIEKWEGYSGAKGADVVGYFRENYRIKGSYEDPY